MIKINKNGFTLSEMLITLSVLGLLGVLVLPGLIKDSTNKASITLLQNTVSNINDAVQNEIMRTRATNLVDTDIFKDPAKFLKNLDCANISNSSITRDYKTLKGATQSITFGKNTATLKNGVFIAIKPDTNTTYNITDIGTVKNALAVVYIDINGNKEPNMIGVDLFKLEIINYNAPTLGRHVGDVGSNGGYGENSLNLCQFGNADACYYVLEASGFDHNYLR